jgi:gliding motility-associated-like protein
LSDATISNPNANPTATTTYTVTARKTATGCTSQSSVLVTVDLSTPTADAGTAFTKTCATNTTGQLIGATAESGVTYSWYPTTGLSDATISNPNANPTATTTYTVTARKTATGCTATNSVIVTVLETPNPVALSTTIANNCPLENVDLTTIQPAAVSGIVYEWWTGTATTRVTQITNPTLYATAGTIYLWSKSVSEGCYNAVPSAVNVTMNVCCESSIGVIQETNPFYLVNYAPADITTLEHVNYTTPSVVRYAIVNDLDGKIKQINTTKPEFTQLPAGNYTVHALVFGPTVVPTGLVVGNKLSQVVPFCGTTATKTLTVQSICSSALSYTETMANVKQYALLNTSTNQFVQVNTSGTFTMIHTGMPHQVIGFNYTGTATGIQVGGTIAGVTATNLDMTAGAIVSGCTAIITQIDGNIYNDKDKRCIEGLNNQTGLPQVTLYAKLLDNTNQVIAVSSAIQSPDYTFSMAPDLLDGVYSIVLDDNNSVTDAVATYPNSWKGNAQTFTIASGQIVEYLSNTANFVPMCMQAATNKPILKPTANLVGNTYNFCKGVAATSLIIDALPGATINWYTTAVGGVAKSTPFIPTTSVVGTTTCYVSQTLNGAESDRTEVIIDVHDLPEQPTAISGSNFIAANTTQLYGVVNSSSAVTYNWILPTDWTGTSTTKDITVQVGTKEGTIGVTATSAFGCISPIQELVVRVVIEDDIEVFNSLSPNGDGDNDIFRIRNIDFYPENTLSIFNRWGIEVYRVNSYGQNDNFFKGFSDGRSTVSRDVELPEGAYFYTLTYKNTKGIERNLSGYLYIKQ